MTTLTDLADRIEKAGGLHDTLANCHPSLSRNKVWCKSCGAMLNFDSAVGLRSGWPKCCGYTMTIDSPEERAALRAKAQMEKDNG